MFVSYGKVNLSSLDQIYIDENKPAKGKCLAKKLEIRSAYRVILRVIFFNNYFYIDRPH